MDNFNLDYLGSRDFINILVGPVTNPGQTEPTATFKYYIKDPDGWTVEQATDGITFTASAGGFSLIEVSASDTVINAQNVMYNFRLRTQDVFTSDAILKISLPPQISVASNYCRVNSGTSGLIDIQSSDVSVLFDRIIYVSNAFPNGMTSI